MRRRSLRNATTAPASGECHFCSPTLLTKAQIARFLTLESAKIIV